jgi:hypothetical protein
MPLKVAQGSLVDVLKGFSWSDAFLKEASYEEAILIILKDLPRNGFVQSNDRTFEDLIKTWTSVSISKFYSQGYIDGSFFALVLSMYWTRLMTSDSASAEVLEKAQQAMASDRRLDLSFAYYDDGGIPCAVSISYSLTEPPLWTTSVIRNTTGTPEKRQVLLIGSSSVLNPDSPDITPEAAMDEFFRMLNSVEISSKLKPVFKDGEIIVGELKKRSLGGEMQLAHKKTPEQIAMIDGKKESYHATKFKFDKKTQLSVNSGDYNKALSKIKVDNPALENATTQSFFRRNRASLALAIGGALFALAGLVGIALILTGVLAPVGIALALSLAAVATSEVVGLSVFLSANSNINQNENVLGRYVQEKKQLQIQRDVKEREIDAHFAAHPEWDEQFLEAECRKAVAEGNDELANSSGFTNVSLPKSPRLTPSSADEAYVDKAQSPSSASGSPHFFTPSPEGTPTRTPATPSLPTLEYVKLFPQMYGGPAVELACRVDNPSKIFLLNDVVLKDYVGGSLANLPDGFYVRIVTKPNVPAVVHVYAIQVQDGCPKVWDNNPNKSFTDKFWDTPEMISQLQKLQDKGQATFTHDPSKDGFTLVAEECNRYTASSPSSSPSV